MNMHPVSFTWGIKPWWKAVKWWWPQNKRTALRIFFNDAKGAIWWSVRYRGLEAEKMVTVSRPHSHFP